jgi:large subunit ribosomal protein L19e
MNLKTKKQVASRMLGVSPKRVKLDPSALSDIQEAITRGDIRNLIGSKLIIKAPARGVSRSRARQILKQKRKGRRKNFGSRKGTLNARSNQKSVWVAKVRVQRELAIELRDKNLVSKATFKDVYRKIKGGYFRNRRHIKIYLDEAKLFVKKEDA